MTIRSKDQLLLDIFVRLTEYWEVESPPEEIGSDDEKIDLMTRVNKALKNTSAVIPERLLRLYKEVYLRDVWK